MFWDKVAGVYDLFVNVYNRKAHKRLCAAVDALIDESDIVLECACGTGMLTVGIAQRCRSLTATDFSPKMLEKARKKCRNCKNVTFSEANILRLPYADGSFDKVVAANVIHLLDEPLAALAELSRVCKKGGKILLPTYINKDKTGKASGFSKAVGKAGADFKRQFTIETYRQFLADAGYPPISCELIEGRVPCAVAVIEKV